MVTLNLSPSFNTRSIEGLKVWVGYIFLFQVNQQYMVEGFTAGFMMHREDIFVM